MQSQSAVYAPYADERRVDLQIQFEMLDVKAKDAAEASASGQAPVSQLAQVTNDTLEMGGKWATLESNLWVLDGSMNILPDEFQTVETGWWSDVLSGDDGSFQAPPWLHFGFGGISVSSAGFTLTFDDKNGDHPARVLVSVYESDGTTVKEQREFTISGASGVTLDFPAEEYYAVRFTFPEMNLPHRRVKVASVLFGFIQMFNGPSLSKATIEYGADETGATLPSAEIRFTFDNSDKKYNLLNPVGIYAFLQEGQAIKARFIINGEAVDMGTEFRFTAAEAKDDALTAQITANDYAKTLDRINAAGGEDKTVTLAEAVSALLEGYGITAEYDGTLGETMVVKAYPGDMKIRAALAHLAQAACCSCWFGRDGVLRFKELTVAEAENDILDADRLANYSGVSVEGMTDKVELNVSNVYADTTLVYTAGDGLYVENVDNPCVASENGEAVAEWLLAQYRRRRRYAVVNRGNPALEIGDTLKIYDAYEQNANAAVKNIRLEYDGGLKATTKAVGA